MIRFRTTLLLIVILILSACFFWYSFTKRKTPVPDGEVLYQIPLSSVYIPDTIVFAGEPVPLNYPDVLESLDREILINTYWHSQTILYLKKSKRFFAIIEPILKKYNIPDDLKYIPVAESGFLNSVSPAGATGIWQILESTAKENGLEVNKYVDERYNIEKATETACQFLLKSYSLYHSWTLAAASYNMGRSAVNKQIKRQKTADYYNLLLGDETGRYVFRLISFKLIMENPSLYGFNLLPSDYYKVHELNKFVVDSSINDLAQWSIDMGINYKILKIFNPWLRDNVLPNKNGKKYIINIPRGNFRHIAKPDLHQIDTAELNQ